MSAILLDTHAFVWGLSGSLELSQVARDALEDSQLTKHFSLASVWEMAIKSGLGKLRLPFGLETTLAMARQTGLLLAPIELDVILAVENLPPHHKDPFDRLLASWCLTRGVTLLSRDPVFDLYGVRRVW